VVVVKDVTERVVVEEIREVDVVTVTSRTETVV
jgi:hypothetical protein